MKTSAEKESGTRLIFLGDASLTDGFRLIGFETWDNPSAEFVTRLITDLVEKNRNAFIVIDQKLAESDIPVLDRVRNEGGRIVIASVPPLNEPWHYQSKIDMQIQTLLGSEQK